LGAKEVRWMAPSLIIDLSGLAITAIGTGVAIYSVFFLGTKKEP